MLRATIGVVGTIARRLARVQPAAFARVVVLVLAFALLAALAAGAAFVAAAGIVAFVATDAHAQSAALPTGPHVGDKPPSPFYRWDRPLPGRAGAMLREEPVALQREISTDAIATRILYTSTDVRWKSGFLPVSGLLFVPRGTPPRGGWPLVAWAHGSAGVADPCAPSWTGHSPRDATYVNRWLEQGFAVVATDYQGLGGPGPYPFMFWGAEARSVLDAVRATLAARPGVVANQVVVAGQSQGSGAAIGVARIVRSYAPEVRLRAAIATGVVSTFPDAKTQPAPTPASPSDAYLTMLRLVGGSIPDDGPTPDRLVSQQGKPLLGAARYACPADMRALVLRDRIDLAAVFAEPQDLLLRRLLPVTDMPRGKLAVPLFVGTGLADRRMPPQRQYAAVAALCESGNAVSWSSYAGAGHEGTMLAAFADALQFARAAIGGDSPAGNALAHTALAGNCKSIAEPGPLQAPARNLPYNE